MDSPATSKSRRIRAIRLRSKNKKEDEKQKKALRQMGHDAAQPRAPSASVAKMRRKLKQKKKQNDEPDESPSKDHAPPKKTAAMKRQLEQHEAAAPQSPPKKAAKKKREDAGMPVTNRGDEKALSVLEMMDAVPSRLPGANKERIVQHRVRTLLANLSKASREKHFPATLVLGKKKASSEKKAPPRFKNVGAEIVKVCLSQPLWALVHRRDFNRGLDEWFETSDKLMRLLDCGDADDINAAMKAAVTKQIDDAMKERVFFEILANVCNNLFKTRVLANKKFDANFVTIATYNTDPVVRSLSIPKYFRALKDNVWQKITDCMDILLTGGGSGDQSAISQLEACAEYVINRAKSKTVEATIKKAVEQATQANKLCTGAFIPTTKENKRYHDPYLYYYHHHFYPPTYYAAPPQMYGPPPPPPVPAPPPAPAAAPPSDTAATAEPASSSLPSDVAAPTPAAEPALPAPSVDGDGAPPPPPPKTPPVKNIPLPPVPKTPSFSPKSCDLSPPRYCTPFQNHSLDLETPSTPGRYLEPSQDLTRFSAADYQLFTPSFDEEFEDGEYLSDEFI